MLTNSSILITGGTGSFGHTFVPMTLTKYSPRRLVIYSRDELKQWEMAKLYGSDDRVRFFIGDVRDKDRLARALNRADGGVDSTFSMEPAEMAQLRVETERAWQALGQVSYGPTQAEKKITALSSVSLHRAGFGRRSTSNTRKYT